MVLPTLKAALRQLARHRFNAAIIILSLTIAFSFATVLLSFVIRELNTDSFHPHNHRIYRLHSDNPFDQGKLMWRIVPEAVDFIQTNFPEVEAVTVVSALEQTGLGPEALFPDMVVLTVDSSFFTLFEYQFIESSPESVLLPESIVLTASAAKKMLGAPPYAGQPIEASLYGTDSQLFTVAGIIADPPENTQLKFNALVFSHQKYQGATYILLTPTTDPEELLAKINQNPAMPSFNNPGDAQYGLTWLRDDYFVAKGEQYYEQSGNKLLIKICWLVVVMITFTASFNFINLFIISLMNRKKEIGIRKVLGASRSELGLKLGGEVGLYMLIALAGSVLLTIRLLPWFNLSFDTNLSLTYLVHGKVLLAVGSLILLVGGLITVYLAFFSWRLNPVSLLSRNVIEKIKINRFLIGAQFFIAIAMVVSAIIVIDQIQFIKNKPLGFNRDLVMLSYPAEGQQKLLPVLKQKLQQHPEFSAVALSSGDPLSPSKTRYEFEDGSFYTPYIISGDEDLIKTLGLHLVSGRQFRAGLSRGQQLVNETFVRHFNMKDPIGAVVPGTEGNIAGPDRIVGVVKDFNTVSLKQEIPPYIIYYDENPRFINRLLIDFSGRELGKIRHLIEKCWQEVYPDYPLHLNLTLVNDTLMARHKKDTQFFRMIINFTVVSVLISCFGLFGIAAFSTTQRTKEIGIRKVLGASVPGILGLLSQDFAKLVGAAFLLAVPVANYFMREWLANFAYKIEIRGWIFIISGVLVLTIALLAIGSQTLRAATRNPVDSLRYE